MENINVHRLPCRYSFVVSRLPWKAISIAECLNPCPFKIDVTLLLYNKEHIRKARTIHETFSFIVLSFNWLKYEIKHENFGQIYWFLVKKIGFFSSRHNYRLLNWSPRTKFHEAHLWTYLKLIIDVEWQDIEMDKFFSLLQTTTSCCKWSKIWLGSGFVGCPPRHRSWSLVILSVRKWHLIRYWVWNKTFCWWLCLLSWN